MKSPIVKTYTTKNLASLVEQGRSAVPKLQRGVVWTGPKAVKLLDSIHRQMPVGTLVGFFIVEAPPDGEGRVPAPWASAARATRSLKAINASLPTARPRNGRGSPRASSA